MFIRSLLTTMLILPAGPALATFELKDPAADYETENRLEAEAAAGQRACFDFLVDSVERPAVYRASLIWAGDALAGTAAGASRLALEDALKTWCADHPKSDIAGAARALGAAGH